MSADNWAICPQCKVRGEAAVDKRRLEVGASYGKVSPQDYLDDLKQAEEFANRQAHMDATFREDYELGVLDDGQFYIIYRGSCSECGLSKEFKHEEVLPLSADAPPVPKPSREKS